jgi:hypothetical protein
MEGSKQGGLECAMGAGTVFEITRHRQLSLSKPVVHSSSIPCSR